jgi:hypothetical protein
MGATDNWRIDVALNDYGLTASHDRVKVSGPDGRTCNEILSHFRTLEHDVKVALSQSEPAIASAVLVVTMGVPPEGQALFAMTEAA